MEPSSHQAKTLRDLAGKFEVFSEVFSRTVKDLSTQCATQGLTLERLNWLVTQMQTRSEEAYRVLHGHNGSEKHRGIVDLVYDHQRRFAFQDKLLWIIITALFALALSTWWNRPTITDDQWRSINTAIRELQRQSGRPLSEGLPDH